MTGRRVTRWTPAQVARELGVPRATILARLERGDFGRAAVREKGRWYVTDIRAARRAKEPGPVVGAVPAPPKALADQEVESWKRAQEAAARKMQMDESTHVPRERAERALADVAEIVASSLEELPASVAAAVSDARMAGPVRRIVKSHVAKIQKRVRERAGKDGAT